MQTVPTGCLVNTFPSALSGDENVGMQAVDGPAHGLSPSKGKTRSLKQSVADNWRILKTEKLREGSCIAGWKKGMSFFGWLSHEHTMISA